MNAHKIINRYRQQASSPSSGKKIRLHLPLTVVTGLAVTAALWWMTGTADAQMSVSINGTARNGGGYVSQYTSAGIETVFVPGLSRPRGLVFDNAGNLFVATNTTDLSGVSHGTILQVSSGGVVNTFATAFPPNLFL